MATTSAAAPAVQAPPPAVTAGAPPVTAMTPSDGGALKAFDPFSGYTPDRTFTVGAGGADGDVIGIANQLYPDNPVAGVSLLARANGLRANAQNSPILVPGQVLAVPGLPTDAGSLAALESDGRTILSANDHGLRVLAARRAAEAQREQQEQQKPDVFTQRFLAGQNVWTGQPVAGISPLQAHPWVPAPLDRLAAIVAAPPLPTPPPIDTFGHDQYADIPDAAGDHLYPVVGYRSDGWPILSGDEFIGAPDLVGDEQARRSAAWLNATDTVAASPLAAGALIATHGAGADERTQLDSVNLGGALGGLALAGGAAMGGVLGFTNAASPGSPAASYSELEGPSDGSGATDVSALEPDTLGASAAEDVDGVIPLIGGKPPINSKFAGQTYPLEKLPLELQIKYPDSVKFKPTGFPDFSPYAIAEITRDDLTGNYRIDGKIASKSSGVLEKPKGYSWRHKEDGKGMQLVPTDIHDAVRHTGGVAVIKNRG